jgi:hypothetical protein
MVKIERDNSGKTRVAKGDQSGLGGQYAPDPAKIASAKTNMESVSSLKPTNVYLGHVLNSYVSAERKQVSNDDVRSLLFDKYGAKKLKSGSREMNDGTFLDPYEGETICRCGEPVSKYELNNGAHVWSHDVNPSKDVYVDMNGERGSYVLDSYSEESLDDDSIEMLELNKAAGVGFEAKVASYIDEEGDNVQVGYISVGKDDDKHSAYPDEFCTSHGVRLVEMEVPASGMAGKLGLKKETVKHCPKCADNVYPAGMTFKQNW